MLLAVQIYAPLDESPYHRTLYQFCCLNPICHTKVQGWVCVRDQVVDTSSSYAAPKLQIATSTSTPVSSTTWLDDADDWGDEENMDGDNGNSSNNSDGTESISNLDIGSLSIEAMKLNCVNETISTENSITSELIPSAEVEGLEEPILLDDLPSKPTVDIRTFFSPSAVAIPELPTAEFSSFYLNVFEEQSAAAFSDQKLDQRAKELLEEYQRRENFDLKKLKNLKTTSGRIDESYEKIPPNHGDLLAHKFITQVQSCPTQLIRYNRGANPLLLKPLVKDDPKLLKCRHCNAPLVFEMQLMPHLSQRLAITGLADSPIEIGTIISYTCSASCWSGSPREEYLVVQSEVN